MNANGDVYARVCAGWHESVRRGIKVDQEQRTICPRSLFHSVIASSCRHPVCKLVRYSLTLEVCNQILQQKKVIWLYPQQLSITVRSGIKDGFMRARGKWCKTLYMRNLARDEDGNWCARLPAPQPQSVREQRRIHYKYTGGVDTGHSPPFPSEPQRLIKIFPPPPLPAIFSESLKLDGGNLITERKEVNDSSRDERQAGHPDFTLRQGQF